MPDWMLRWNFNKASYQPGEMGTVSFWLENKADDVLFASELGVRFDWMKDSYYMLECANQVPARSNAFISNIRFEVPKDVVGQRLYAVKYHLQELDRQTRSWIDLGEGWSRERSQIGVFPRPFYRAFVSRGVRPEDQAIGDPIVELLHEWGFDTVTVGIDRFVLEPGQLAPDIRAEITRADCLIAIATPRYLDALSGLWRTLEWLHGELGIAYGVTKPVLILRDEGIVLGGLPSALKEMQLAFSPYSLDGLRDKLAAVMPTLREAIAAKQAEELRETIGKVALGVGILIAGGIAGYLAASSGSDKS